MEIFGDLACLVSLQRADEVPLQAWQRKCVYFVYGFLHVILAEGRLPCGHSSPYAGCRPGLAYGQYPDIRRLPSAILRRGADACENGLQVGGNCCHNRIRPEKLWKYNTPLIAPED